MGIGGHNRCNSSFPSERARPPREAVAEFLCTGVVTALCANHPGIYPHHRWTGADLACDDLGLIESVHCLLSGTYIRFLVLFQQSLAGKTLAQCALGSAIRDTAHMLMLEDGGGAGNLEGQSSSGQADDPAAPASIEAGSDESPAAAMARINAANRRAAARWLSQSPLADLVLIRLTMEPLRQLLTEQLQVAGMCGKWASSAGQRRQWRRAALVSASETSG